MGEAYQCDKCGMYFPSLPKHRVIAKRSFTGDTRSLEEFRQGYSQLDLCSACAKSFDLKMIEVYGVYLEGYSKRQGKVRWDEGHPGATDEENGDEIT